jgi:tripartite-type tricarboxylate transporter receptor subunit TctC
MNRRFLLSLMALALAAAPLGAAHAQRYPTQRIVVVVPFAAGGAVDSLARVVAVRVSESLGQPVIIENKPGAGGNLAADAVAKSAPDGHTILLTTNGQAISPSLYRSLPYDPVKDLIPVTQLIESPLLLVVTPKLPAKTLNELIALAKEKPGSLNYGSTGVGNPLHLSMEMLKSATGIDVQAVPYRGDAPLNTALMAGEVHMAIVPVATAVANVESNLIRAIAVTSAERSKALPHVATIGEQGVPGFDTGSWQGFFVPANTPREIVLRIQQETRKALDAPDVRERLKAFVAEPVGSTPDEFAQRFTADIAQYAKIVKEAGIPLQN